MKLVSATKYDIELKDWDMDRIKAVENTYGKVSRGIHLRIQALLGNTPDGPQIQLLEFSIMLWLEFRVMPWLRLRRVWPVRSCNVHSQGL